MVRSIWEDQLTGKTGALDLTGNITADGSKQKGDKLSFSKKQLNLAFKLQPKIQCLVDSMG